MEPVNWRRAEEIFHKAVECAGENRGALVDAECSGDESLRREVESLLAFHEQSHGVIDSPAFEEGLQAFLNENKDELGHEVRIGSYRILREIGRGGIGAVYLAERADDQFQKQVAVKIIQSGVATNELVRRFRAERQILANLDHPNIAGFFDGGATDDGRPYLVMEYVEGLSISEYCETHGLSIDERLEIFLAVCSAVEFAHRNLVVHRDIKPGNILVTSDRIPKLLDFGIAKLIDPALANADAQTATILRVMTPEYASPEQARGLPITTATDIYSLGVLLYELLTGRRPYQISSKTPAEIERIICTVEPEKPSTAGIKQIADSTKAGHDERRTGANDDERPASQSAYGNRQLKGDLDNIVLMAMRKEPARRYVSVTQFAEDIRRHLHGLPIVAHKDTFSYRASKFVARHKIGVAAASLILVTLIAGVVGIVWQSRVAARERDRARLEAAKAERINQFLQDTLGFADTGWFSASSGKGPRATIGEALDQAAKRAEAELSNQPDVLAAVLLTIGTSYRNLAQFDLAEKYLQRSLDLSRQSFGPDSVQAANAAKGVGEIMILKGKYLDAEPLLQKTLTVYRRHSADGTVKPLWLAGTLDDLGLLKSSLGQPAAAEPFLREALTIASQLTGNDRSEIGIALTNLGQARAAQNDFAEAANLYRQAIDEYRRLPGPERSQIATTLSLLGETLKLEGNYAEAETVLREAINAGRRVDGENSPNVAVASTSLGHLLYLKGDYKGAEEQVNHALAIGRQLLPPGHVGLTGPATVLGLIMSKTGRSREAEPILREALATRERAFPKGHWQIAFTKGALGECLTAQKRYVEAEPLLMESYNDMKTSQGEQNPRTVEARKRLAGLYEQWSKPELSAQFR